jgi:hypothetical protein
MPLARSASLAFAAGAVGGLANGAALWAASESGLLAALDVTLAPAFASAFWTQRLAWGGIWGLLFLLPLPGGWKTGLLLSLAPSAAQLLVLLPRAGRGWLGLEAGALAPLVVIALNAVWGATAAAWLRETRGQA